MIRNLSCAAYVVMFPMDTNDQNTIKCVSPSALIYIAPSWVNIITGSLVWNSTRFIFLPPWCLEMVWFLNRPLTNHFREIFSVNLLKETEECQTQIIVQVWVLHEWALWPLPIGYNIFTLLLCVIYTHSGGQNY